MIKIQISQTGSCEKKVFWKKTLKKKTLKSFELPTGKNTKFCVKTSDFFKMNKRRIRKVSIK